MTYFAVKELGLTFDDALYNEAASRIMLLLNQYSLSNIGDENMMTLTDIEAMENLKNG